jgi:hypothetical protein
MCAAGCAACAVRAEDKTAIIDVEDFRRAGMTDTEVIRAALQAWQRAGGGTLRFGANRHYALGRVDTGPNLFTVSQLEHSTLQGNGAEIVATSARGAVWNCFSFSNVDGLEIANLSFRDNGYRGDVAGMKALVFQPGFQGTRRIGLSHIRANGVLTMVQTQGPVDGAPRVQEIAFRTGCVASRSYYALCCQDQGDRVSGKIRCVDCRRAYLVYGVDGHDLHLTIESASQSGVAPSRSPVLVKSYGRATTRLNLRVTFLGDLPFHGQATPDRGSCLMLEVQGAPGSRPRIANIDIAVDLSSARRGGAEPAVLTLSSVDQNGRPASRAAGPFADIALSVRSAQRETVVIPRSEVGRAGLAFTGDVNPVAMISASQAP